MNSVPISFLVAIVCCYLYKYFLLIDQEKKIKILCGKFTILVDPTNC